MTSQPSYGYNSPVPDQYNPVSNFAPINPVHPGLNQMNPGLNQMNPGLNHMNPGLNQANPLVNGSYYTPQPAVEPIPAAPSKPTAPGWNDPPMLSSKPKVSLNEFRFPVRFSSILFTTFSCSHRSVKKTFIKLY